jgi:hypothetical protein
MQPTTAHDTVSRLRAGPAMASGPAVLVIVLAVVIVALAAGLGAVLVTGQGAAAMP